ncbi:MAG: MG2 domain-containing protein [Chthoniobacterales bacterium]
MLKLPGSFFVALSCFTMVSAAVAAEKDVELLTDAEFLQPTSTFEFRFATPVVGRDEVGTVAGTPPINIEPAISGTFTWLSQRSGVFVPTAPPPLGTEFTVTIRPDFRDLNGNPAGQTFRGVLKTPPYGITLAFAPQKTTSAEAPNGEVHEAKPPITLAFNLETALDPSRFRFVSAAGEEIAGDVRYATGSDYLNIPATDLDWNRWWNERAAAQTGELTEEDQKKPLRDRMIVTPVDPLEGGQEWKLEIAAGLKSLSGEQEIKEAKTVPIGVIQRFEISNLETTNYIQSGKAIRVHFSHIFASDIQSDSAKQFFQVEPTVDHLRYEADSDDLTIFGDFALGQSYQLTIGPDVVDTDGATFSGERSRTVQFSPVKPRIYLPVVSGDQYRGGARQFEALSINVRQLHVRALLVDPANGPSAKRAFAAYNQIDNGEQSESEEQGVGSGEEPNRRVAEGKLGGKLIYDRTIDVSAAIDKRIKTEINWDEIIGANRGGMVLLTIDGDPMPEAGQKRAGAQALLQVTDIGILWARESEKLRFFVFSLSSGQPIANAGIHLLNADSKEIGKIASDESGVAIIPFSEDIEWAEVRQQNDAYALHLGKTAEGLPMSGFNLDIFYPEWVKAAPAENARCFVFTDRPLYRPGEVVHVKGLVRALKASGLEPAAALKGDAEITGPRGDSVASQEIVTARDGSFEADIPLSANSIGRHELKISFGGSDETPLSAFANFEVADYEPNAFELNIAMPERIGPTTPARAEVTAKYLFGAPLTRAKVRWTLQATPTAVSPSGFENFQFASQDEQAKTTVANGSGNYDPSQPFVIEPTLPSSEGKPIRGVLTVDMTDLNQQTVTESRIFQRDTASFYLGITVPTKIIEEGLIASGVPIPIQCVAVTPDGKPVERGMDVQLELIRKRDETVRVKGAGKAVSFRTNSIEEKLGEWHGQTLQPTRGTNGWEILGAKTAEVTLPAAGEYILRARAQDENGRPVWTEYQLYNSGDEGVSWNFRNAAQIDLVTDKLEYSVGETATILVKSPFTGDAVVNIERAGDILRSHRIKLEGNAPTLEVPIMAGDVPNIYVSVVLVRGANDSTRKIKTPEFRYGFAMLRVSDPATKLRVDVAPPKSSFEPGEPVEVNLKVQDGLGRPVSNGAIAFFAVDDGVLALTGYERPDPNKTFFGNFPLKVQTGMTLDSLLAEDPTDLQFSNKGYLIGGGGGEGPGLKLRTDFPGTVCWMPSVRTDSSGHATVKFTAPDAITRYRLVAVAWAGGNQFGSSESAITIQKPLLITPSMAPLARTGDRLAARAVIRNDAGHQENIHVQLKLDDHFSSASPTETSFTLENGATQTVDFSVTAAGPGTSHWQWSARSQDHSDGVASTSEIEPAGSVLREVYLSDIQAKPGDLLASINPQLLEGKGVVNVTLSNTRLTSLQEAIRSLRAYPYECSEQLSSSLVPWLVKEQLKSAVPRLVANETAQREDDEDTLNVLFNRQTDSGGLALWPSGNEPSLFASAYTAWIVAGLQQQGVEVPAGKWKSLLKYLSDTLRGLPKIEDDVRLQELAFASLALAAAGKPEPAYQEALFEKKGALSHETRAVVALAFLASVSPRRDVIEALLDAKSSGPDAISLYGGDARGDALRLLAWTRYRPRSAEVAPLVKELLGLRHNGRWDTTQENAWSLLALASYYRALEGGGKAVDGLLISGPRSLPFSLTRQAPSWSTAFVLDPANPIKDILVKRNGTGALFAEAQFEVYPAVTEQPRQDRGYSVSRVYQKIDDDGKLAPAKNLKVGDRIVVTLNIKSDRAGHLVAIDDPVPAIFEPINPAFRPDTGEELSPGQDYADFREIRDNHVEFFRDQFPAGDYHFTYLSRVRFAGEATAPGAKVLEMYRPDRFGLSETVTVRSER